MTILTLIEHDWTQDIIKWGNNLFIRKEILFIMFYGDIFKKRRKHETRRKRPLGSGALVFKIVFFFLFF